MCLRHCRSPTRENVDTDQIIPARFLKATERKGFGDNLFRDWRYNQDDSPKGLCLKQPKIQRKNSCWRKELWFWFIKRTRGMGSL